MELIIWLIFGAMAGMVYRNKGRSYRVAFIGGFVLGPIALLLALLSSSDSAGKARQARKSEEEQILAGIKKRCEVCNELIDVDAKMCKHCRSAQLMAA